jgi:signal transduction histidine kinase
METDVTHGKVDDSAGFDQSRRRTDGSLIIERGKTDESISRLRTATELDTDKTVKAVRRASDQTLEQSHLNSNIVDAERAKVDVAIQNERQQNQSDSDSSLERNRTDTDENLQRERAQTDIEALRSSALLRGEVNSHSETKIELTSRDEFLAIVSHDLRNPIGSIKSCADALLEEIDDATSAAQLKKWVEIIKRNAESSLRLINDILDMERIAEGKLEVVLAQNDVRSILGEAVESVTHVAFAKNISLEFKALTTPIYVRCDRDRMSQVLSNLIGNALKFTPNGGRVTLKEELHTTELLISICDTGPGIPLDQQSKIFDRFTQLSNKDRQGLGIGLYISKMLIEAHGGRLWIDSTPKNGCTFSFTIPLGK